MITKPDAWLFTDDAQDAKAIPRKTIEVAPGKRMRLAESASTSMILDKPIAALPTAVTQPGRVVLKAIVTPYGTVKELSVISGPQALVAAAMQAAQKYRFKPLVFEDHLVEMETQITIEFKRTSNAKN